jgi:hypothetical protein|tara:strand:- start:848 stop:1753 length:906 start_codon:yes stop_codon:yes gene_type:complete
MELYFWILIGAILLVSLTIILARPTHNKSRSIEYDNLEGIISESSDNSSIKNNSKNSDIQNNNTDNENKENLTPEVLEKLERRKWALGFVMFGSAFTMVGAVLLFLSDLEFIIFLGSSMIYVGIIALIKGASFELQKDGISKESFSSAFFVIIYFINFILLTELLGVIGNYAWTVATLNRKIGDLALILVLPYLIWKIVPTFGAEKDIEKTPFYRPSINKSILFAFFNYTLIIITGKEIIFWPVLNQYASLSFQFSLIVILISCFTNATYSYSNKRSKPRVERVRKQALLETQTDERRDDE